MTAYSSGRRFEWEVKKYFEDNGFFVVRNPVSRFPDLVCVKRGIVLAVECKYGSSKLSNRERVNLLKLNKCFGMTPVLATKKRRGVLKISYL